MDMHIVDLSCDYMTNPLGLDFIRPSFGWRTDCADIDGSQSVYQIQITTDESFTAPILDTGRVASGLSAGVQLDPPLAPRSRYYWRVRIWNDRDEVSDWSEPAWFETGKYDEPWQAKWIGWNEVDRDDGGKFPQLRGDFTLDKPIRSARAYACGVGLYVIYVNGQRVGDEYLSPGINAYDSWLQYQVYDLTDMLRPGRNAIGAQLGNGYYKGRVNWPEIRYRFGDRTNIFGDRLAFICELHIQYEDGSEAVFCTDTDGSWKVSPSPWLRAEIYDGEVYDARRIIDDWCMPGYDASGWEEVCPVDIDMKLLTAHKSVSARLHERFKPIAVIATPAGETVLDFGQNLAGLLRFETDAPEGTELWFQFGEALDRDGNFYRANMRTALAEIKYICDGQKREYCSSFTFFGFRYVKVTGWPGEIDPDKFTSEAIYSDLPMIGSFECSDSRVNKLVQNSLWGLKSNFVDLPTDCPQRDERLGWTGDAQVICCTASMFMQTDAFFRKYLYDLAIEQKKDGFVPVVVPNILRKTGIWQLTTTGWGDAATVIPWTMYMQYGDKVILEIQYESMKAWVDYMTSQDTLGVDRYYGFHLGDWLAQDTKDPDNWFGLTPTDLIATAYYALSSRVMAWTAEALGKEEDAKYYAELAERVTKAFRKEYVTPGGRVVSETQTAQAIALYFDLLRPEDRDVTAKHLAERVRVDHCKLTTGFLGTPCLCPALSGSGLNEYAYALLLQNECPSWLYEVEMGATTMWERWNSVRPDGSFGPASMNSLNHYAFGAICEWLYRWVAGINPAEPGYKKALLRPLPNSQLQHASASLDTPYGRLRSRWELNDEGIELEFEIPFNAGAEIVLPDADGIEVTEYACSVDGTPRVDTRFVYSTPLTRGSGVWKYRYTPNGSTIDRRVPEEVMPDI